MEPFIYLDDSALVDISEKEDVFEEEAGKLLEWCERNFLEMNVKKTKKMVLKSGRSTTVIKELFIKN